MNGNQDRCGHEEEEAEEYLTREEAEECLKASKQIVEEAGNTIHIDRRHQGPKGYVVVVTIQYPPDYEANRPWLLNYPHLRPE